MIGSKYCGWMFEVRAACSGEEAPGGTAGSDTGSERECERERRRASVCEESGHKKSELPYVSILLEISAEDA